MVVAEDGQIVATNHNLAERLLDSQELTARRHLFRGADAALLRAMTQSAASHQGAWHNGEN